jgi:alpha-mannosidase/mannosylglycerate hydrolase
MSTPPRLRAHYVLSTHWDREWYQSFQNYRVQLVRLLDQVLAGLEDGRLQGPFQTDGQAIILEDYLEIRPDRRPQLERLAQAKRLIIGPWYVLPDEFLVSGESLVRNIRLGRTIARSFGAQPSQAGFVCDLFGHNSQMPQIFAGFGIHGGFIWRGLNHLQTRHVRWSGADGSEMAVYRFPGGGYCDYTFAVRHAREHDHSVTTERIRNDLRTYLEYEAEHTEVDPILVFDGGDHEAWDQATYSGLLQFSAQPDNEFEIVHTSLDAYLDELLPQANRISTQVKGELRDPGQFYEDQQWVIPGVLSSRVWIKQANAECESLLTQWAEPFTLAAHALLGDEIPQGFLDVAWRWLLKNHPHDSICGCSIDVVHEDMKYRFSQCRQIAERLTREATQRIAAAVGGDVADHELRIVLFNPAAQPLQETVELDLQIPTEWPSFNEFFGFEPKPAFRIFGPDGQEIPYQRLGQTLNRRKVRIYETKFPESYTSHDITVSLPVQIAALGYTTLTLRAEPTGHATRHPNVPGLATSERSMENEFLNATIESNGTLTLYDKRTNATYSRLLTFEDCADIGDGWYHGQAVNDQVFVSTAAQAAVALVHNGPMLTAFRVRTTLQVPDQFLFDDTMRRSEHLVDLVIDSRISLRPGVPRLEISSTVHNIAGDHRVRVLLPSGCNATTYWADSPFDLVERPIALRHDNHLYRELEVETRPQQTWTAVYSEQRGLAVVSTGLLETAVRDIPEQPVALTLFRSTRRTVFTNGEPNGQLQGDLTFRYWIAPLTAAPDPQTLFSWSQQVAAGLRATQMRQADIDLHRTGTILPPQSSLLTLQGDAVMTSVRHVESGIEVRIFNPTHATAPIELQLADALHAQRIFLVDFESNPTGEALSVNDNIVTVNLVAKKIVTIRIE